MIRYLLTLCWRQTWKIARHFQASSGWFLYHWQQI